MYDVKGLPSIVMSTRLAGFVHLDVHAAGAHRAARSAPPARENRATERQRMPELLCTGLTLAIKSYHMTTNFKLATTLVLTAVALAPLARAGAEKDAPSRPKPP